MKKIYLLITFIFFCTSSVSETINSLDIEGIKIGDDIHKYMSSETIKKVRSNLKSNYKSDRYKRVIYAKIHGYNGKIYDQLMFHYDSSGKIGSISGDLIFKGKTIEQCIGRSLSIIDDIKQKVNTNLLGDPKKKIKSENLAGWTTFSQFKFNDGRVKIACSFPTINNWVPSLRISIASRDFVNWLNYEAFK
jgi:hypothetical protein